MRLRLAGEDDLDFILSQEARREFATMAGSSPLAEHLEALQDPDARYLLAEDDRGESLAYVILKGLSLPHRSIEMKRIIVAEPGRGLGKRCLRAVISMVFEDLGAHRLWLDVFTDNARARAAYRAVGFVEEGVLRDALLREDGFASLVLMSILEGEYPEAQT